MSFTNDSLLTLPEYLELFGYSALPVHFEIARYNLVVTEKYTKEQQRFDFKYWHKHKSKIFYRNAPKLKHASSSLLSPPLCTNRTSSTILSILPAAFQKQRKRPLVIDFRV